MDPRGDLPRGGRCDMGEAHQPVASEALASLHLRGTRNAEARRDAASVRVGEVIHSVRGRRRKLPVMTNSERAKYYRHKHAERGHELHADTKHLRKEVLYLQIRLQIHRQLIRARTPTVVLERILFFVGQFVEDTIHTKSHGLHSQRHELQSVEMLGDGVAPIVRVQSAVQGKLTTSVIHRIYPFVLGNTVVLDEMMHKEVSYNCVYVFFFSCEGVVEREEVVLDTVVGLRRVLMDVKTATRVASEVDVHTNAMASADR